MVYDGKIVNHSHNDYAEALAETGIIGGLCGLAFLVLLFWNVWKTLTVEQGAANFAYHAGAFIGCLGLLVHATVDFNFHIPANALIFLLQAALATSVTPASAERRGLNLPAEGARVRTGSRIDRRRSEAVPSSS